MDLLTQKKWFDSKEFELQYHCDIPQGAFPSDHGTVFRLWAPTAEDVVLHLYAEGEGGRPFATHWMQKQPHGLWELVLPENLHGVYYEYEITVSGESCRTADPWAKACGVNSKRSMVVELSRTDPEGWEGDKAPVRRPDDIIYELHVKDFSWDPAGGFPQDVRGKFAALGLRGTTLHSDGVHPTGLDYLKSLGVTHIQLLPVYDYGSVDEAGSPEQFNWGYDPMNYNVPEGSYSSDPHRGEVRIRELKEAIMALHKNGFRVIMDVVYNHTYKPDSFLNRTVPGYYYRQDETGALSNGSGCGNDLATERSMCGKYILDSVLYWTEEYHMDGFRFDLMGLLDAPLMETIRTALDEKYGKGEKLVYGEPWSAGGTGCREGTELCHKGQLKNLSAGIGAFSDDTRDAIKGGLMDEKAAGFVNGGKLSVSKLKNCVTAWAGPVFRTPNQTITYVSCHDDWTLWDKLVCTMDPERNFKAVTPELLRANRLAAAIYFLCQGRPFLLSGEEFGRTKDGVKNSYNASPAINRLDWQRAWDNRALVDYYRGLMALRMLLPAVQDKSENAAKRVLKAVELQSGCVSMVLDNGADKWDRVLLIVSVCKEPVTCPLPKGTWQVLADSESSFRWKEPRVVTGSMEAAPVSALILGRLSQ